MKIRFRRHERPECGEMRRRIPLFFVILMIVGFLTLLYFLICGMIALLSFGTVG